jgi:outer membrane protein assembly factor BamD (BamD/ComL family)
VNWTPTILIFDSNGRERHRIEGYLSKDECLAQLKMGLARIAFNQKKWAVAERIYGEILENYAKTSSAPEARYWMAAAEYQATHNHTVLSPAAKELQEKWPQSVWALKALPWLND